MADRAAIDTIRGYFYQFDHSILQLLKLTNDTDTITVEGIEDIDISSATEETAIQCKYYSKSEYNHSIIAEPIRLMLTHFSEYKKGNAPKILYILRGHYKSGHHKLKLPIAIDSLKKNFLTFTSTIKDVKTTFEHHVRLGLDDNQLNEFLKQLTIDVNAVDFDHQFTELIGLLKTQFACSDFTSEHFYYNNALRVIKELSIKKNCKSRTISKIDFIQAINTSQILFNEWFLEKKGRKAHFSNLRKEYFTSLNISPFERFFIIEISPSNYNRAELKDLLFIISKKWSKLAKREPKPFCPYVYIHNLDQDELVALKKELLSEEFNIIDGYDFNGAEFNPSSIVRKADHSSQIRLKVINEPSFIDQVLHVAKGTKQIFQFYLTQPFYVNTDPSIKHIQIQINQLENIRNII